MTQINKKWKTFSPSPPIPIKVSFANSYENIWIADYTSYYESALYHFDGKRWNNKYHPLANQINSISFIDDNNGVVGGLGELAFYNNGNWKFETLPFDGVIRKIILLKNKNLWLVETSMGVWNFNGTDWSRQLMEHKIVSIIESSDSILYAFSNSTIFYLKNNSWHIHSKSDLLNGVNSLSIIDSSNIWGCGIKGKIIKYEEHKWNIENSPVNENLNNIVMINKLNGWIVGNNGTILNYNNLDSEITPYNLGFEKRFIYSDAKIIDDQYGVVISDFTKDGYPDIFALGVFENIHYYINRQTGFTESSKLYGIDKTESKYSTRFNNLTLAAVAGDIDNDGDNDLYITSLNDKNSIYQNYNNGHFRLLPTSEHAAGLKTDRSNSTSMSDIDNDGDLDIFVTNETSSNKLYLNNGNGYYTDVTDQVELQTLKGGTGCAIADIDNDDDADIIVVNWAKENKLYKNMLSETGKLSFLDVTKLSHISGFPYTKSNGVITFDADNDGDLDLFITNRKTSNRYYLNDGNGIFSDVTEQNIGIDSLSSYGVVAADVDNDGDKDLYISNVGDNKFYENSGDGKYVEKTKQYELELDGYSTGSATGDIDNDGDIDIYASNFVGASSLLFVNKRNDKNYLKIKVTGTISNRNGIGSKISIYAQGHLGDKNYLLSYGEIQAGSGYASSNDFVYHTGIINHKNVDVQIYFPYSRITRKIKNIKVGNVIEILEEEGFAGNFSIAKRNLINLLTNKTVHFELLKFSLVLFFLLLAQKIWAKKFNWNFIQSSVLIFSFSVFYWIHIYFFKYSGIILSTILPITGVLFILILIHIYLQKKIIQKNAIIEKQQTRERISRDLHDDVASTLTSISIYNESLRRIVNTNNPSANKIFTKINNLIIDAAESVANIVWSVTPKHDTFESLLSRIRTLLNEICTENNLNHKLKIEIGEKNISISGVARHNIYMIFKEALHNIVKHAQANNVSINIGLKKGSLFFMIVDDGIGIDISSSKNSNSTLGGNGIENMQKRAEQIDAEFAISSTSTKGTIITLSIKNNTNELLLI